MKVIQFGFCVAIFLCISAVAFAVPRTKISLDAGWRFSLGDPENAASSGFDDVKWQNVKIPHTWNAADAFDDEPGYHRGPAWYRRQLNIGPELKGKQRYLYFEGANQVADVFVNGQNAGRHIGGYTALLSILPGLQNRA